MGSLNDRGLRAALEQVHRRIAMAVARAVVRLVDDSEARQRLQVEILAGELRDGVERAQNYGFTSHPHPGCDAIIVCGGGVREQAVAVVVDDRRYRLQLQPGEVALYDDLGNRVTLLRDKVHLVAVQEAHVEAPAVRITAPDVTIEAENISITGTLSIDGDVAVNGDTTFQGSVTANGKRIDDTHTHGGVQPGGGNTGVPN